MHGKRDRGLSVVFTNRFKSTDATVSAGQKRFPLELQKLADWSEYGEGMDSGLRMPERLDGQFSAFHSEFESMHYFQVSTSNETACRGMENFKSTFPSSTRTFFCGESATSCPAFSSSEYCSSETGSGDPVLIQAA
jgi:hypothetical protein